MEGKCDLCKREKELTFHHLIPRKVHKNSRVMRLHTKKYMREAGIDVCKDCHRMIHRSHSHIYLALEYYNLELLKTSPKVIKFVKWVTKQKRGVKF